MRGLFKILLRIIVAIEIRLSEPLHCCRVAALRCFDERSLVHHIERRTLHKVLHVRAAHDRAAEQRAAHQIRALLACDIPGRQLFSVNLQQDARLFGIQPVIQLLELLIADEAREPAAGLEERAHVVAQHLIRRCAGALPAFLFHAQAALLHAAAGLVVIELPAHHDLQFPRLCIGGVEKQIRRLDEVHSQIDVVLLAFRLMLQQPLQRLDAAKEIRSCHFLLLSIIDSDSPPAHSDRAG